MDGGLRGAGNFDRSHNFLRNDGRALDIPETDNAGEKRKKALARGLGSPKEMPGIEGRPGERVKITNEVPYLTMQLREIALRKELGRLLDQEAAQKAFDKRNLVVMSKDGLTKDEIKALAIKLAAEAGDDALPNK